MRSDWIRVGPKSNMTGVFVRKEGTLRYTEGRQPWEEGGRNRNDTPTNQGMPRTASNQQRLGRDKKRFFPRAFRGSKALQSP